MLFRSDIQPSCSYCKHGLDMGRNEIACRNHGIMSAEGYCSSFCYEPTKRNPEFSSNLNVTHLNLTEEDFKL